MFTWYVSSSSEATICVLQPSCLGECCLGSVKICNVFIIFIIAGTVCLSTAEKWSGDSHAFYCYFPLCINFFSALLSPCEVREKYENKLHVIRRKIAVFKRCWWNLFFIEKLWEERKGCEGIYTLDTRSLFSDFPTSLLLKTLQGDWIWCFALQIFWKYYLFKQNPFKRMVWLLCYFFPNFLETETRTT